MPNKAAVTVVKIKNFSTGTREICAHKLMTKAVEQPTIKIPPTISPQRILLCSMNDTSTSANGLRGGFKTSGGWMCSAESFAQAPNCGAAPETEVVCGDAGIANGDGPAFSVSRRTAGLDSPTSGLIGGAAPEVRGALKSGVNSDGCLAVPGRPCGKRSCSRSLSIFVLSTRRLTPSNAPA